MDFGIDIDGQYFDADYDDVQYDNFNYEHEHGNEVSSDNADIILD
jgi:hypothetical protein|nr:MAG TPA: hypothetical protein [Crassvirales sp.]